MKTKIFIVISLLLTMSASLFAQLADNEDEVVKIDKWNQNAYRPNEVIVHFREDGKVQMRAPQRAKFKGAAVSAVDQLFETLGVDSVEELMPMTGKKQLPRRMRAYNGQEIEIKPLGKLYRLCLSPEKEQNVYEVIEKLQSLDEVDYAEPNYIVYALGTPAEDIEIPRDEIQLPIYQGGVKRSLRAPAEASNDSAIYVQEPLYSQQWGLQAINIHKLWNKPKITTKRPVIAILDTGVDTEHPDLAANIWTNDREANGLDGQDDDNNGFADDIHGWDFINQTGDMHDYNGHGTHCAGIAAAVGDNGIGITGANPDALIMPISVMQSDGTGDVATIIKGIDYATQNGADVISMSLGHYSYSISEEQALGRAYTTEILVAAAGNDKLGIDGYAMFPACYTFVLGVEASTKEPLCAGYLACWSNLDYTGPIYSTYNEEKLYNYELRAPGENILSTFPNGRYKVFNGTSMACPLAAGAISRLVQTKEILNKEMLFGDLIHTRQYSLIDIDKKNNIDIYSTYNISDADRIPTLWLVGYNLKDSIGGDGDSRPDAGETMEIYPIFRNDWGQAENIRYWLKLGFYNDGDWVDDDTTLITFLTDTAYFEKPLSGYAKAITKNPLRFAISPNCVDGRHINVTLFAICDNISDTLRQHIVLEVENGVEIGGMITEDMTLYPNVHYIVTRPLAVPAGVTLTIKPGTIIRFKDETGINVAVKTKFSISYDHSSGVQIDDNIRQYDRESSARIIAEGTPDSMIVFTKADLAQGNYDLRVGAFPVCVERYTWVEGQDGQKREPTYMKVFDTELERDVLKYCKVEYARTITGHFEESIISDVKRLEGVSCEKCNIYNNPFVDDHYIAMKHTNLINNFNSYKCEYWNFLEDCWSFHNIVSCNLFPTHLMDVGLGVDDYVIVSSNSQEIRSIKMVAPSYFASARESTVRQWIWDFDSGHGYAQFDLSNMLRSPVREAHGIVWKILIDSIDTQDEFELLPPIGIGQHKCEIYFNRPMDTKITPFVSYGVRPPYTQHVVNENGSWSADSTIYTVYFTIDGKTISDGLNRIYVADARDDNHFEIPFENFRFNMEIAAAGSMSTGLLATPGLGKVTLNWETDEDDFEDLLGYNIYRWTDDTIKSGNTWMFDTICINSSLIDAADTSFIDYDVVPGKDYYYVIRQMTTSLNNYDLSNPVVARPLTATKGDSNGSMSVNVADVLTTVAYIMHEDPQPFIFEAADVNNDTIINIFDVVGTVNLILNPQSAGISSVNDPAYYSVEDGILYVETDAVLGGVQVILYADSLCSIEALEALDGFERVGQWQNENQYLFMAYSMSKKTLSPGKHALLRIGDAELESIVLSDPLGKEIAVMRKTPTSVTTVETMQISTAYPNPFTTELDIPYVIGENGKQRAQVVVTDVTGRTIDRMSVAASYGSHTLTWKPLILNSGIYFINLYVDDVLIQTEKVVKK